MQAQKVRFASMDDFAGGGVVAPEGGVTELPPPGTPDGGGPPVRKIAKWPFVLAGFFLLIGIAISVVLIWPIQVPYYAFSPGPAYDVDEFVEVPEDTESEGELYFLTVSLREVNLLEWIQAQLDPRVDLAPRENVRPAGVSQEELQQQNRDLMDTSKQNAIFVALTELGYDVTYEAEGAEISSIIEDSAADGVLQVGDVIVSVDGEDVEFSADAVDLIGGHPPGTTIRLEVDRPVDEAQADYQRETFEIVLGPYRAVDENGDLVEDPERGMVGVLLATHNLNVIFPIEVQIDSRNVGGPSAGLMFTLEIIDSLDTGDLTRGARIAGTGTIQPDGTVGAIGGVVQKVYGAIDIGAEYMLVPADNYDDAITAAGDDIELVRVANLADALAFLETL
jgi:PDZ domain-containing protein